MSAQTLPPIPPARPIHNQNFRLVPAAAATPTRRVAALYTRKNSVYETLGLDCWGIDRDAAAYPGPGPVIAHPPCGHHGRYKHNCTLPGRELVYIALSQVRRFGGILEHPTSSDFWDELQITRQPGQRDLSGGQLLRLNQFDYGHAALKDTTLYIVGVPGLASLGPGLSPILRVPRPLEHLSRSQRQATPLLFAQSLLNLANQVESP